MTRALAFLVVIALAACPPPKPEPAGCGNEPPCPEGAVCENNLCVRPCTTDEECNGRRCNPERQRCEGCLTDDDCEVAGTICLMNGVCSPVGGCSMDSECGGGRCNVEKHACVACLSDEQCSFGKACNQESGACTPAANFCTSDEQCNGRHCLTSRNRCVDCLSDAHCDGVACDLANNVCLVPCMDPDTSEPNNTESTAVTLMPGSSRNGHLCPADIDEAKIVLPADGHFSAVLSVEGSTNARLQLHRASDMLVQEGVVSVMGLSVDEANLEAGTYFLKVFADGTVSTSYTLRTTYLPSGTVCTQEASEPNDTPQTAAPVTTDGAARGGALCPGDVDHFSVDVMSGDRLRVLAVGQGGSVTATLLDAMGSVVTMGSPLQSDALDAGRYTIRLSTTASTPVPYTLSVSASAGPPPCRQSDAEPNDSSTQATTLAGDGSPTEGAICPGDVDRFKIVARDRDRIAASIAITPGSGMGPLNIQLVDAMGTEIASGTSMVDASQLAAGTYELILRGANVNAQAAYLLTTTITRNEPPMDPCLDNGLEPNDAPAQATGLTLSAPVTARICAMDEDFFTLMVPSTAVVRVLVTFIHMNGDLDIELLDAQGEVVAQSNGVVDEEVIEQQLTAGTYVVHIFGFNGASNPYTVRADIASCPGDDVYEENDRPASATPIAPGTINGVRCPGDDDHFRVVLLAGDTLSASITNGLTTEILDGTGMVLSSGSMASASMLPAGAYVLRVTGGNAMNTSYALTVDVTPGDGRMCIDDGAEEDDTIGTARRIPPLALSDGEATAPGVACQGDDDWFSVDLTGPSRISADLVFDAAASDLDLYLDERRGYADLTRTLASSNGTTTQEHIEGSVPSAGTVSFQVRRYTGLDAPPYGLRIRTEPLSAPDGGCIDDLADTALAFGGPDGGLKTRDDDTAANAIALSSDGDAVRARAVCPGDSDWYAVSLSTGNRLTLDVRYTFAAGDLDVRVFKPSAPDSSATGGFSSDDDEHVEYTATESGVHRIQVYGYQGASNTYALTLSVAR